MVELANPARSTWLYSSGSIIGAFVTGYFVPSIQLKDLIMLSQGYGSYSMTGIVVTELKNAHLGSIALMNDLFREIFAIVSMYTIGWRYPRYTISVCRSYSNGCHPTDGAKQACGNDFLSTCHGERFHPVSFGTDCRQCIGCTIKHSALFNAVFLFCYCHFAHQQFFLKFNP